MTRILLRTLLVIAAVVGAPGSRAQNISVDPLAIDFGILDVGNSALSEVILTSLGPTPLTITSVFIDDDPFGVFSVDGPIGTTILLPGEFAVATVEFFPLAVAAFDANLHIRSDASGLDDEIDVALHGVAQKATMVSEPDTLLLMVLGAMGLLVATRFGRATGGE